MSDVFKWILATILRCALLASPMLIAQETPPAENASAQQPAAKVPDGLKNPQPVAVAQESSSEATEPDRPSARPTLAELMQEFRSLEEFATLLRVIEQQSVTFDSIKSQIAFGMERAGRRHRVDREFVTLGTDFKTTVLAYNLDGLPIDPASSLAKANLMVVADGKLPMSDAGSLPLNFAERILNASSLSELFQQHPGQFALDWDNGQAIIRFALAAEVGGLPAQIRMRQDGEGRWVPVQYDFSYKEEDAFHLHWELTNLDNLAKWYSGDYLPKGYCEFVWGSLKERSLFLRTEFEVQKRTALLPFSQPVANSGRSDVGDAEAPKQFNPLATTSGGSGSPFGERGSRAGSSNADPSTSNASVPIDTVDEEQLKIFHLQHSDANETRNVIEQLFAGSMVTVAVDARTNTLIVRCNEPLLQQIEAILLRLDEQPGQQAPIVSSTTGTNANSAITIMPDPTSTSELPIVPIAEYRRRLNELELPLLQLAEKVRSTEASLGKEHPESLKQRDDLRESIQKTFAARQEIQRAELAEFTRRLQHMQQSIDARDRIADKIVDRRLEEFLNPEADWNLPLSARLEDSKSKVVLSEAKAATKYVRLPTHLFGTWAVEELSIKSAGIDISTINPKPRLTVTADHLVVPMDGGITITMQYELIEGDPLRANLTFDGSHARTFGIIKYSNESLWLCFREPADKGEPALTESNRPIDFLPGDKYYCIKCRKSSPVSETKAGPSTQLEPHIEPDSGTSVSELIPESAFTSEENDTPFAITRWRPKSEAEKAIGRLVLVFFEDKARRAVPALLIQHGQETIALTAGPATIVPGNIEHAIDRTFLEFYDREDVPTTYADFSTPDLALHIAKEELTSFQLENPVALKTDDRLSAILMHGQADFEVTADAARITAVDQRTTWQLPSHNLNREFTGLFQIDKRLPEGTPLFKNGELAGITLLGTRFMTDDFPGSYVVPASRIVEVLQQLKIE